MRHYIARQLESGGWHMTSGEGDNIHAVGYCGVNHRHDTEQEAQDCYKKYLLDNYVKLFTLEDQQLPCAVCGAWTQNDIHIGGGMWGSFILCDEHNTRESLEQLFRVGEAWMS